MHAPRYKAAKIPKPLHNHTAPAGYDAASHHTTRKEGENHNMAQLHANNDNSWSITAESEEEALLVINGLNNCLEHPELDTVEKIQAYLAQQANSEEGEDNAE